MVDETRINWNNDSSEVQFIQQDNDTITMTNSEKAITTDTWYDLQNMR
jgi:hypothetical protein